MSQKSNFFRIRCRIQVEGPKYASSSDKICVCTEKHCSSVKMRRIFWFASHHEQKSEKNWGMFPNSGLNSLNLLKTCQHVSKNVWKTEFLTVMNLKSRREAILRDRLGFLRNSSGRRRNKSPSCCKQSGHFWWWHSNSEHYSEIVLLDNLQQGGGSALHRPENLINQIIWVMVILKLRTVLRGLYLDRGVVSNTPIDNVFRHCREKLQKNLFRFFEAKIRKM